MCLRTARAERLAPGSHPTQRFFFEIRWVKRFRARLRTLGRGKCGVKRPTCRIRVGFLFVGVLCVARLKRTNEGPSPRERSFSEGLRRRLSSSVGPFAACRLFRCRPRLWSCVMLHGVRVSRLLFRGQRARVATKYTAIVNTATRALPW